MDSNFINRGYLTLPIIFIKKIQIYVNVNPFYLSSIVIENNVIHLRSKEIERYM